jgi:hypothetical protein
MPVHMKLFPAKLFREAMILIMELPKRKRGLPESVLSRQVRKELGGANRRRSTLSEQLGVGDEPKPPQLASFQPVPPPLRPQARTSQLLTESDSEEKIRWAAMSEATPTPQSPHCLRLG